MDENADAPNSVNFEAFACGCGLLTQSYTELGTKFHKEEMLRAKRN
jgi:hypothetical protein